MENTGLFELYPSQITILQQSENPLLMFVSRSIQPGSGVAQSRDSNRLLIRRGGGVATEEIRGTGKDNQWVFS